MSTTARALPDLPVQLTDDLAVGDVSRHRIRDEPPASSTSTGIDSAAAAVAVRQLLTALGVDTLDTELAPKGVGVVLEAEHMCMSLRGVQATGSRTVTSALRGQFRQDPRSRQEFLTLTSPR